jgi:hypothetical protein
VANQPRRSLPTGPLATRPENETLDVYNSYGRLTQQMDNLVSFTGNGGGSEIKVGCFSAYLQPSGSVVTKFASEVPTFAFSRKDIRKGHFVSIESPWHRNWQPSDLELAYVVWEEDNRGEKLVTPSAVTTVRGSNGATWPERISSRIPITAQESVIRQLTLSRKAYYATARISLGCTDDPYLADFAFSTSQQGYWPIYDCGANWSWTMPFTLR